MTIHTSHLGFELIYGMYMEFIADNMLGKLAKWMRFMGHDVYYEKISDDKELIELSRSENRYLLTRDKELAKTKDLQVLFIKSEKLENQLRQVIKEFNLQLNGQEFTRCPECNHILYVVDKSEVIGKVPNGVQSRQESFWHCELCQRYYWQGTHYEKIKTKLEELCSNQ